MWHVLTGAAVATALLVAGCAGASSDESAGSPAAPAEEVSGTAPAADGTGDAGAGTAPADPAGDTATLPEDTSTEDDAGELSVTVGAAGDLLPHASVIASAADYAGGAEGGYEFGPMFEDVADLLSTSDLTLCHLETPLTPDNTGLTTQGVLSFNTPYQLAGALAEVGFDGCEFASNHTMDRGLDGVADTEQVVRDAGLGYAGPTAQEDRAGLAEVYETAGAAVAHLAYTYTYPNDGSPTTVVPGEAPWLERNLWPAVGAEGILEDAAAARGDGADFVVVSMHWGQEYATEPTTDQRRIASELLESDDVDLVLGTHVHVVQPCEVVNGKHVLYGLGNFLSNQSPDTTGGALRPETQEGMVAQVTLHRDGSGVVTSELRVQPTWVDLDGHVVRPATTATRPETYRRTLETLTSLGPGACDPGPLEP
jgi:poly-gamma-glutamate capsule biosynthesis protein CapA/YwtB (metallophosphatase superfamily)